MGKGAITVALALAWPVHAQDLPPLDPAAPMAPLPDLGVAWPDLDQPDAAVPADAPASVQGGDEARRYSVTLAGIEELPSTVALRFAEGSVLEREDGDEANAAQIERRAQEDVELLQTILRSEGYYDAGVTTAVANEGDRLRVTLTVEPGARYRFQDVRVAGLEGTGAQAPELREAYGVETGDPIDAETVLGSQADLRSELLRSGYPFARVPDPDVLVDHAETAGTLTQAVEPGPLRRFGAIRVEGARPPFDARHAGVIARFEPGQLYNQDLVDDYRRALIATGIVGAVDVRAVEGTQAGTVDMLTRLDPAPLRTLAGEVGYGTGEGFRVEASWQHRNLIRPEGAVTFRGIAGTREQLLGATLRMSNFRRRDQALNARMLASRSRLEAYDASTVQLGGSIERQSNILWQKKWTYSLGAEILATDERDFVARVGREARRTFFIAALPAFLQYDGSDDLLDPKDGFRLSARVSPEASLQNSVFSYLRTQFDASGYYTPAQRVTLAGRVRLGATLGASRERIAPSRLFYSGGGGSVRGYGYQSIGARDPLGDPIGGRSVNEFSLEARVRLPVFGGNFGLVPFLDGGQTYGSSFPRFTDWQFGAGVGLRYYSLFGPIRIDVGTPLNRRAGDARIAVQVSLGQAF